MANRVFKNLFINSTGNSFSALTKVRKEDEGIEREYEPKRAIYEEGGSVSKTAKITSVQ